MKNTNLKRVLSLILSISIFLFCNMGNIKVKAKEVQSAENIQEKTAIGGEDVVDFAMSLLGKPYEYRGDTPEGFDLGGFTMYVYSNSVGINIDSEVCWQEYYGRPVNYEDIKSGDLVFTDDNSGARIVGIYVGNDEYIYASEKGVIIEKISNFQCARRIIDDENQKILKVNKGETYEITNTSDEVMYLLTDNIKADVDAVNYSNDNIITKRSTNEWREIESKTTVKFTVLEENGINIYYPDNVESNIKKVDMPALYDVNIEYGKNYELVNNSHCKFKDFFDFKEKFTYVYFTDYSIQSELNTKFHIGYFEKNEKIKFSKYNKSNLSFKLPYELKDSLKEVHTPILKKVILNKGELLELSGDGDKRINYYTSATYENGIRYSQVFRGNYFGPWYEVRYNTCNQGRFVNKAKIKLESGDKLEIGLPYDFYGYKTVKEEPIYYEAEIFPGQVYEFRNIYQTSRENLVLSTSYANNLRGIVFNYKGNTNSMYTYDDMIQLKGGDVAQFKTLGYEPVKLYLPIEYKNLLSIVYGSISEEYSYEIEDINKDKRIDALDLSIVASNYNTIQIVMDENNEKVFDCSFDERCDFNEDGTIDVYDLVAVAKKF